MKNQDTIDLHGLHTREALHALINFLDNAHRRKLFRLYLFSCSLWKQAHSLGILKTWVCMGYLH